MVSERYLGESWLLYSSWGNKFQQGLGKKKKKKKDPHGPAKWHSQSGWEPDHMSLWTLIPSSVSKKNLQHLSCTHLSHRQRHILRILCPHTQVPNIYNICSQGKGNVCLKAREKSYPSALRMSWKPSDRGLKWAYWRNIFAVMRFLFQQPYAHI